LNFKKLKDSPKISNVKNLKNVSEEKINFYSIEKNKNILKKKQSRRKKSKNQRHSNQSMSPISQTKNKFFFG